MKLNKSRRALALGACTATAVAGLSAFGIEMATAAPDPKPIDVILGVGSTQADRTVSWYVKSSATEALQISEGTSLAATPKTIIATTAANTVTDTSTSHAEKGDGNEALTLTNQSGFENAHVDLHNLKPGTSYTYRVGNADGSSWSDTFTFKTDAESSNFKFLFFGDPQIGSSSHAHNDGRGWAQTLQYAQDHDSDAQLYVSGGDQVETANSEYQWSNFADPDTAAADSATGETTAPGSFLKTHTWAPTIGNHEGGGGGRAYQQHFFPPNVNNDNKFFAADGAVAAPAGSPTPGAAGSTEGTHNPTTYPGGDYWYVYNGVLFIDLNSNAYAGGSDPAHVAFVEDVIKNHGAGTKWQVLTYHHSIYSPSVDHANDKDNSQRRIDFTQAFSELGVDIVLQGHDHSYSRSYVLKGDKTKLGAATKANAAETPGASSVTTGPGGVIYITADSSSGSKFYDLAAPDGTGAGGAVDTSKNGGDYGPDTQFPDAKTDNNTARHWANSVEAQPYAPSYVKVEVSDTKLAVTDLSAVAWDSKFNSAIKYSTGNVALATAGDKRSGVTDVHHEQTPGAVVDKFDLHTGNSNVPDDQVQLPTTTVTLPGQTITNNVPTPTANETSTRALVNAKITQLTRQVRKAKGTKKKTLKAQLNAYKAVRAKLH